MGQITPEHQGELGVADGQRKLVKTTLDAGGKWWVRTGREVGKRKREMVVVWTRVEVVEGESAVNLGY